MRTELRNHKNVGDTPYYMGFENSADISYHCKKFQAMQKIHHYLITFLDRRKNKLYSTNIIEYTIDRAREYARVLLANDTQGAKTFRIKKIK